MAGKLAAERHACREGSQVFEAVLVQPLRQLPTPAETSAIIKAMFHRERLLARNCSEKEPKRVLSFQFLASDRSCVLVSGHVPFNPCK